MPGRAHIVDDDSSFATAVKRRLKHAGYEVVIYASAQDLLDRLPNESTPSCILLDAGIRGIGGLALQTRLGELGSTLPIIFLSDHPDIPATVRAIKAGAEDFLTKPVTCKSLVRAIERCLAHHQTSRELQSKLDVVRARITTLTPRERQVFQLIVRGQINKQVGKTLGSTERTIKAHRHRVMEKMQVRSLAELVSLAERVGALGEASSNEKPIGLGAELKRNAPIGATGTKSRVTVYLRDESRSVRSHSDLNGPVLDRLS